MSEPQEDPNEISENYPVVCVMILGRKFTAAFVGPAMGKGLTPKSYWVCDDSEKDARQTAIEIAGEIWCRYLSGNGRNLDGTITDESEIYYDRDYYCRKGEDPTVHVWPGLVGPCAALAEYLNYCETCGHLKKSHKPLACTIVMGGIMSGPCDCKAFVAQKAD